MKRPPIIKDKSIIQYIEYLEERLAKYEKSPYVKTYLTLMNQLNDFNEQLTIKEIEVQGDNGIKKNITLGRIDLFGTKDEKEFERSFKYMLEVNKFLDNLDSIRKKMTKEEKEELKTDEKKPLSEESAENYLKK